MCNSPKVVTTPEAMGSVPLVDSYLDIKSYDLLTPATAWMNLESLNLIKGSQAQRTTYGMFVFI